MGRDYTTGTTVTGAYRRIEIGVARTVHMQPAPAESNTDAEIWRKRSLGFSDLAEDLLFEFQLDDSGAYVAKLSIEEFDKLIERKEKLLELRPEKKEQGNAW